MTAQTKPIKRTSTKRLPSKSYHHGDLHREILLAARKLLEENNISSLSLREVAKKVGVSHTAPYRHFKDKESLLAGIAGLGFNELTEQMKEVAELHPDPSAQLQEAGQRYIQLAIKNPQCIQLMFGGILPGDDTYPMLRESGDMAFNALKTIIAKGQALGVFKKGNIELLALTAWSGIHGLSLLFISGSVTQAISTSTSKSKPKSTSLEIPFLTNAVTEMLINGLKAD